MVVALHAKAEAETRQTCNHERLGELLEKMVESEPWRNACG
jgi:hypothetical protein